MNHQIQTPRWSAALRGAAAVTAAAALGVVGPAAHAAILEEGGDTWDESFPFTCDYGTADTADDIDIVLGFRGSDSWRLKSRGPANPLTIGFFMGRGAERVTVTVPDAGITWYADQSWLEKDLRIVSVDGPLVTIDVGRNWHVDVVDPAGAPHGSSDYRSEFRVVVDTRTGEGEYLGEDKAAGRIATTNACEDARLFTTS